MLLSYTLNTGLAGIPIWNSIICYHVAEYSMGIYIALLG